MKLVKQSYVHQMWITRIQQTQIIIQFEVDFGCLKIKIQHKSMSVAGVINWIKLYLYPISESKSAVHGCTIDLLPNSLVEGSLMRL